MTSQNITQKRMVQAHRVDQAPRNVPHRIVPHRVKKEAMLPILVRAFMTSPDRRLAVRDLYEFVIKNSKNGEYNTGDKVWQKNVRHLLSTKGFFRLTTERKMAQGKGCYWLFDEPLYKQYLESKRSRSMAATTGHQAMRSYIVGRNTGGSNGDLGNSQATTQSQISEKQSNYIYNQPPHPTPQYLQSTSQYLQANILPNKESNYFFPYFSPINKEAFYNQPGLKPLNQESLANLSGNISDIYENNYSDS